MLDHVCDRHGLLWYIPAVAGPPTVVELVAQYGIEAGWNVYPLTPDGYTMPPPYGVAAADLIDEMHVYTTLRVSEDQPIESDA
jgi:hypothetical protein